MHRPLTYVYAGVGTRESWSEAETRMREAGQRLDALGFRLRSGGAKGSDTVWESCAVKVEPEIYLPWEGFRGHSSPLHPPSPRAYEIAETFHPRWDRCDAKARALHARNSHQVLGQDCESPVDFVCCLTTDGTASGGTGQAMRIAAAHRIPVFNFWSPTAADRLWRWLRQRGVQV